MAATRPRYSKEEFARRGEEIFEREIQTQVAGRDKSDFVLIDIETGTFEVDADELAAATRLRARVPGAQIWGRRVGSRYSRRFGGRRFGRRSND
jgi:hypothetical protein